jgi:hypothetical protein
MDATEPDPGAHGAVAELAPGMFEQLDHIVRNPSFLGRRVPRDKTLDATGPIPPAPD